MSGDTVPLSPVLVTGANGFIGSALCRKLVEAGCEVRGLILEGTDPGVLERMGASHQACDITRPETLTGLFQDVKTVFHVAALARDWGKWKDFMAANFGGTSNVLEKAIQAGAQRFVQVSSLAVHPFTGHVDADESTPATNRINGYCASKIAAEQLVSRAQREGLIQTTIVRPGAIIHGPGDTTTFVHLAPYLEKGKLVLINDGRQLTCYAYSENLADGLLLAGARPEAVGEVITLNDDIKITIRDLMTAICQALGAPPRFSSVPRPVARAGGWVLDRLWRLFRRPNPPPVHRYRVAIVARDFHFTAKKAKRLLGYQPAVPLEEGLRRTVEWYRGL